MCNIDYSEFEKVCDILHLVSCNTTAAKELVSETKRSINTFNEQARGVIKTLPFDYIPRQLMIEFIYFVVLWLNAFPVKTGMSTIYSPKELLVQWKLDYKKHCRVLPGTYCKVHDKPLSSKSMIERIQA